MNINRIMGRGALALLLALVASSQVYAQATRTWVSGVGDDANPCSRTAPCKTFAGAISKTATGGVINTLDSGGFGAVTITKSITIEADGVIGGVLSAGTNGVIINAAPTDNIVLRGISIDGIGTGINGIRFLAGASLVVDQCEIRNVTTNGIDFQPAGTARLFVSDTTITRAMNAGIFVNAGVAGSAAVSLERVNLVRNKNGVLAQKGVVSITDSAITGSDTTGISGNSSTNTVRISLTNSTISDGASVGINVFGGTSSIFISDSTIAGNSTGLQALAGGVINSFGNNRIFGNTSAGPLPTPVGQQ